MQELPVSFVRRSQRSYRGPHQRPHLYIINESMLGTTVRLLLRLISRLDCPEDSNRCGPFPLSDRCLVGGLWRCTGAIRAMGCPLRRQSMNIMFVPLSQPAARLPWSVLRGVVTVRGIRYG